MALTASPARGAGRDTCALWSAFSSVEAEAAVNALRRWRCSLVSLADLGHVRRRQLPSAHDPYIRLVLDRCLPPEVEEKLCSEPVDRLVQDIISVRTSVVDETVLHWTTGGIKQVVLIGSGYDTRAWRLRWPSNTCVYEIDAAIIQSQKMIALGDIQPRCARVSVSGSVSHTAAMLRSLRACGFDASRPVALVVEGVVEQMLPEPASELFAQLSLGCCSGSRMVVTMSDCRLKHLVRRHGRAYHLVEDYEAPGLMLNRAINAGWQDDELVLPGLMENRFDVDLHGCLYIAKLLKP